MSIFPTFDTESLFEPSSADEEVVAPKTSRRTSKKASNTAQTHDPDTRTMVIQRLVGFFAQLDGVTDSD